ncbi:MAG: hypothetical protein MJ252_21675 [archaeon]|nr:hypothetical protein [archaeon]
MSNQEQDNNNRHRDHPSHSNSDIKTEEVKEYLNNFELESVLNEAVNKVLLELPPDPFSAICSIAKKHCLDTFNIENISLTNELNNDFLKVPTLNITLSYKGNTRKIFSYPLPYNDEDRQKMTENPNEIIDLFCKIFIKELENFSFETIDDFDENLTKILSEIPNENIQLGKILVNGLSFSMLKSISLMCEQPLYEFIEEKYQNFILKSENIPNLGFSIFKTGKTMNSKVKFERFMVIIDNKNNLDQNTLIDIVNKFYASLRKVLTAGKAGENGMRLNNEGSFYPPSDKLEDILKLLEGVIKEVDIPDVLKLGIDCNANNYYVESEKTYEMDGFKKNPDSKQLIEFYVKLLNDHPLIEYLEEPFSKDDSDGLFEFMLKLRNEKPNVLIVSKATEPKIPLKKEETIPEPGEKKEGELTLGEVDNSQGIKTEEQPKKEDEEEKDKSNYLSLRIGKMNTLSDIVKIINDLRNEQGGEEEEAMIDTGICLWDCDVETNQNIVVELGMALRVKTIFLNGILMKDEKIGKIKEYIENIQHLTCTTQRTEENAENAGSKKAVVIEENADEI